ncbi:methyltransferase family protein [Hoeflea ulvae]|uniref:Isoprenylcysteine carboxylmethyltransferase family protein n=1 Tax=Hoeflea ulvae TaxID=2983764 RepID=A0ABT3YF98_9HYPH|nr:isoprenylcysteine carboxylmethyltransferase family protein [Hoeflea ulvae]MCY0094425.1 isoprenylcysteine carboxylmethyltransferase family protein [Hoeflea ulvae]
MTDLLQPKAFEQKKRLLVVQLFSLVAILALLVSRPYWSEALPLHEAMEIAGLGLILVCMFGRLWSILYVGSRKNSELVTSGPYSVTRNPLYLFSTIGIFGVGLVFGSISVAFVFGALSYLVFTLTAQREAAFLRSSFGASYRAYEASTPRFWPDPRLYHQPDEMTFSPRALKRTFVDALYFLAMFPAIEGIEYLQTAGYLPTLFWLP